jgi:hypothetical protein
VIRRWKTPVPLALAVIVALLGAYILLVERHRATTDGARADRLPLLPGMAGAQVATIVIARSTQPLYRLRRVPPTLGAEAEWRIEPGGHPAAGGAVGELLDCLDGLEIDRETDAAPEITGVASPTVTIEIAAAGAGRSDATLQLGRVDASARGVFLRRAGEGRTVVVTRRLLDLVDREPGAFRDRQVIPAGAGLVQGAAALAWSAPAQPRRTLHRTAGMWLNDQGLFASRVAVARVLRALGDLRAAGFPSSSSAPSEATPQRAVEIDGADRRVTLRAFDGGRCRAAGDGGADWRVERLQRFDGAGSAAEGGGGREDGAAWFCLDGAAIDGLWRALDLAGRRELRLLSVEPAEVDGVMLSAGQRRLHLRRETGAGAWRIVEPAVGYAADGPTIDRWLARLAATPIEGGASGPGAASIAARRLRLEGAQSESIDVAPPRGARAALQRAGEAEPATAGAALFAELDPDPLRFRSRIVLSLARLDVERLDLGSPNGQLSARKDSTGIWRDLDDPAVAIDRAALEALLNTFTNLEAQRFLPAPPPPFTPDRTIEVTARQGESPRRYRLELSRSCLARAADTPIFELGAADCATLRASILAGPAKR